MSKKTKITVISASVVGAALIVAHSVWLVSVFKKSGGESAGNTEIAVENVTGNAGKTVKVPVTISENPGVMGIMFELDYDSDKLEYISFSKGSVVTDCEVNDNGGKITVVIVEDNDVKKNGTIADFSFRVKSGASGKADIKLNNVSMCNYNEETVTAEPVSGGVTVKK